MKAMAKLMVLMAVMSIVGAGPVLAAPAFVVPQGPPVWCFGLNQFDQCVLYLGTAETCRNLAPCSASSLGIPSTDLTMCFGADDVTGECKLFLGTEERCESLDPCRSVNGLLPRPGQLTTPR